jgi:hypothetical protein
MVTPSEEAYHRSYQEVLRAVQHLKDKESHTARLSLYRWLRRNLRWNLRERNLANARVSLELRELDRAVRAIEREYRRSGRIPWPLQSQQEEMRSQAARKLLLENAREKTRRQRKKQAKLVEKQKVRQQQKIAQLIARAPTRAELAEVASPAPSLADGRLHAGPNIVYDAPAIDDDLPTLPIRQRAIIQTLLSDLPRNTPKFLQTALQSYDEELKVRGVQPILGLLKDMASIIESAFTGEDALDDWIQSGMQTAFKRFTENHSLFMRHFPLDPKREELYARTPIDEESAVGSHMSEPFELVAKATVDANKAGLTTDDFLRIVDKMADFAKVISTIPPKRPSPDAIFPKVAPENHIVVGGAVSTKKRILLSGFGFFERVYNLLANSAQLASPPAGNILLTALRRALGALSKFVMGG